MWRTLATGIAALALIAAALAYSYDAGRTKSMQECRATLLEWREKVEAQLQRQREAQQQRLDDLQGRFNELQSRPEKIREVVRRVEVSPDAQCGSLPGSWRVLVNAAYDSGYDAGSTAAGMDNAARVAVADAAGQLREARERFEINASRLTALQDYVRAVIAREE